MEMDVYVRLRNFLGFDDDDIEIVLIVLLMWRGQTSHYSNLLVRQRLTLQRIARERRIGITNVNC